MHLISCPTYQYYSQPPTHAFVSVGSFNKFNPGIDYVCLAQQHVNFYRCHADKPDIYLGMFHDDDKTCNV